MPKAKVWLSWLYLALLLPLLAACGGTARAAAMSAGSSTAAVSAAPTSSMAAPASAAEATTATAPSAAATAPRSTGSGTAPVVATTAGTTSAATLAVDAPRLTGAITVFAAASLTDAFKEIGALLQRANPDASIAFNFAGSPTLRTQLSQGARADVFASADEATMQGAQKDGSIGGTPAIFAQNRLVVIVPAANPAGIATLQDLAKPGVKLDLAASAVPVGNYARQAFAKMAKDSTFGSDFAAAVARNVVSNESDVKQVLAKVQLGEVDAGVVYATDVTPAARSAVKLIAIPDQFNVVAQYPMAVVKGAANAAGAQAFITFVLSPAGQAVLAMYGFAPLPGADATTATVKATAASTAPAGYGR